MDELHLIGSQDLHLICRLEDKYLPSVPLLHIVVPRDYPRTAPFCDSQQPDYGITKKEFVVVVAFALIFLSLSLFYLCVDVSGFTRSVLQGLSDRLRNLPQRFTVSQILNCWEIAVRHACQPSNNAPSCNRDVSALTVALGV